MELERIVLIGLALLLLTGIFVLTGCKKRSTVLSTTVIGYNHTENSILYTVDGHIGGHVPAHSSGSEVCCIGVPLWRPGLTTTVNWTTASMDGRETKQDHQRVVTIPEYDAYRAAQMSVHFLRNGEIKVFFPPFGLGNPDYPLKGEEAELYPGESPLLGSEYVPRTSGDRKTDLLKYMSGIVPMRDIPPEVRDPFFEEQLQAMQRHGLVDFHDQVAYLMMAFYTSGHFVENAAVQVRLSKPQSAYSDSFSDWSKTVLNDVEHTGRPLWETCCSTTVNEKGESK